MRFPIISHLGTSAMALILAVFLWGFAYLQNQDTATLRFTVQFDARQGVRITPPSTTVDLTVRGPRRLVDTFRAEAPSVVRKRIEDSDIAGLVDGMPVPVSLSPADFITADKRLVFENLPMKIPDVKAFREETVALPLKIATKGTPPPGYAFDPVRSFVRPAFVNVTGPESLLKNAKAIYTKPVDLSGLPPHFDYTERVDATIDGQPVQVDVTSARVFIELERKLSETSLADIPVNVIMAPDYSYKFSISPAQVTVAVTGPAEILATLQAKDVLAFVAVTREHTPRPLPYTVGIRVLLLAPAGLTATAVPDNAALTVSAP